MASYTELFELRSNAPLLNKITAAVAVKADAIRADGAATAEQKAWALRAFTNPEGEAQKIIWAVLAANKTFTVEQITGATDVAIQTAVDAVIPIFAV